MTVDVGDLVDSYLLDHVIHRGRATTVFAATDLALGRRVAFKALTGAGDAAAVSRFVREAQIAASLDTHPGIVTVYKWGQSGPTPYLVTEFITGISLAELIERQPGGGGLPIVEALDLLGQVAAAVDFAHQRGAVHRDIKPANIMVQMTEVPRRAYLVDFGITETGDRPGAGDEVSAGQFLGTPDYAAPEQIAGGPVDERADVYSFACTAYDVLSGRPPFGDSADDTARLAAHLQLTVPSIAALRPELPTGVDAVFRTALAKDPAARYETCAAMVAALRTELPGGALEFHRPPTRSSTEAKAFDAAAVPRRRWPYVVAAAVLGAATAATGWLLTDGVRHRAVEVSIGRNVTIPTTLSPTTTTTSTTLPPPPPTNPYGEVVGQPVTAPGNGSGASTFVLAVQSRVFDAAAIAAPGSPALYYAEWARLMGPASGEAGPVAATEGGYQINAGEPVELAEFEYGVAGLVSSFSECQEPITGGDPACTTLDSPTGGLLMHPPCELGAEGCMSVRSESGAIVARKIMDVALRRPARSALYELLPGNPTPAASEPAAVPAITSISNPSGSVRFLANGRYFVLHLSAEPAADAEVLTIVYGDGTTDEMRISYP